MAHMAYFKAIGKSAWHIWGNEHNSGWAEKEEAITSQNDRFCLNIFLKCMSSHGSAFLSL